MTKKTLLDVELCDVRILKTHEEINPDRFVELKAKIEKDGFWTHPIVIDHDHGVVLDGHHRFEIAKALGLRRIPVILVDYFGSGIEVCQRRSDIPVSKESVIRQAKAKQNYPHKTTKHTCVINGENCPIIHMAPEIRIPLSDLR
ncbi:hypothetical protein AUK40_03315 [Candidatus Wirthbacteria bacterium CG2_30_54_11]|uniref:ParB-like N-terminal domain-containing protein n=1 Tax=Candidatus Wirthbacteria bacterium CG2_30_54_11 TaxID=1817892 RepID=A0A1J5IJR9_9BACT|nr:MAG: hypothetical protein AUK40_03315 [Candidatus Wirthbacteria bacterium CG2_30_54_11]